MFYSKSTRGFYTYDIHGENMPSDVVEITAEQYYALMEGQSSGKEIVPDKKGYPVLKNVVISKEEKRRIADQQARAYLASTDWYVTRLQETGKPIPQEILDARQAARDSILGS